MKKFLSTPLIILMMILGLSTSSMMATSPTSVLTVWMYVVPVAEGPISEPKPDPK